MGSESFSRAMGRKRAASDLGGQAIALAEKALPTPSGLASGAAGFVAYAAPIATGAGRLTSPSRSMLLPRFPDPISISKGRRMARRVFLPPSCWP